MSHPTIYITPHYTLYRRTSNRVKRYKRRRRKHISIRTPSWDLEEPHQHENEEHVDSIGDVLLDMESQKQTSELSQNESFTNMTNEPKAKEVESSGSKFRDVFKDLLYGFLNAIPTQFNYYRIHLLFFVLGSLFFGMILFAMENGPCSSGLSFVDALYLGTSSLTVTGLSTHNLAQFCFATQFVIWTEMLLGGLILTTLPVVILRKHYYRSYVRSVLKKSRTVTAEHIAKNAGYKEWMEAKIPDSELACKPSVSHSTSPQKDVRFGSVYQPENDRQHFIAVDLKSANYQALREFAPTLVDNCTTWVEFLKQFTDSPYFFECKRLRMKCFSYIDLKTKKMLLDHHKQKKMWENMTKSILQNLVDHSQVFLRKEFASWNSDELVFCVDEKQLECKASRCQEALQKYFPQWQVRVSSFQLRRISPKQPFFAVLHTDERVDFKCCNGEELPQIIKKWENREVDERDLAINKKKVIEW